MMQTFVDGFLRMLAGEPWMERRRRERRSPIDRRRSRGRESPAQERRLGERRREDRREKGWLRFWNPP
jgi:hypothetical protein